MVLRLPPQLDLSRYPVEVTLDDGALVVMRPLEPGDEGALLAFFQRVSPEDRFYLREDVTDPDVVRHWVEHMDYERVLPLVACRGERIIADATLHRRGFGARRRLAEFRVVVDPEFRRRGLSETLLSEAIDLASTTDITRIEVEIVSGKQAVAGDIVERFGFQESAVLRGHLRDADGDPRDLVIFTLDLVEE
jgi:GNAT superfamily N-acetyltransferase